MTKERGKDTSDFGLTSNIEVRRWLVRYRVKGRIPWSRTLPINGPLIRGWNKDILGLGFSRVKITI